MISQSASDVRLKVMLPSSAHRSGASFRKPSYFKQFGKREPLVAVSRAMQGPMIDSTKSELTREQVIERAIGSDGSIRLCVDYRKLNLKTVKDAFPLLRIDESFDALKGAKYFSTIDLASGYHQVVVDEQDRHKAAFTTPFGLFEYLHVFIKFTQAFPTRDQKAETTAKVLLREWFMKYGVLERLHSDQGRNFETGNAQCEHFNRTMHELLHTLPANKKKHWPEHLPELVYAYNVTPHASTGYSPYYLLYGVEPHLPVDALLAKEHPGNNKLEWLAVHQQRLKEAHAKAKEYAEQKAAECIAIQSDKVYCPAIAIGQHVYLRHRPAGRNKIQDAWGATVYQVLDIVGTTYTVQPAEGGPSKRVNRVDIRPFISPPKPTPRNVAKPVRESDVVIETNIESDRRSDGESEEGVVVEDVSFGLNPGFNAESLPVENCEYELVESMSEPEKDEVPARGQGEAESVEPESWLDPQSVSQSTFPIDCNRKKLGSEFGVNPPIPAPRRSKRINAGTHPNPHHEPRSVLESLSPAVVSQILCYCGTVFFREALKEVKNSYVVTADVDSCAGENVTRW
ncbi:hypothetical protein Q8A73_005195 [Channa argus]|nr:hypothetical protein Q8A73_005195 [Channa argus]